MSEGTYKTRDTRFSQKVNSISSSGIRRFFELIAKMDGCISLGVGEPDFVTPERYIGYFKELMTLRPRPSGMLDPNDVLAVMSRYATEPYRP